MKEILLNGWNFMRGLRLVMGLYIISISIADKNYFFMAIGAFFVYQSFTNTGCSACAIAPKGKSNETETIEYEEIKAEK